MGKVDSSRLIVAYHGTDESVVRRVLSGKQDLLPSKRDYDWLGNGVYFWEQGPRRALEFAYEMAALNRNDVKNPAVIGAYINLGDCLDFLDTADTQLISKFHQLFRQQFVGLKNDKLRSDGTKLFHRLDCFVINSLVEFLKETNEREIDTVRGCFWEGKNVYRGAQIREKSHIQIAVRNHGCILGYFRPRKLTI
jgi:hypothetical protein